jgi:hypothetical protein
MRNLMHTCLGSALVAALFLCVSASASALPTPEFRHGGHSLEPEQKVPFTGESGTATLKTAKTTIECSKDTLSGEIVGPTTVNKLVYKFTKCSSGGLECESPLASKGEIVTSPLTGHTAYLKAEKGGPGGLLIEPTSGKVVAEFKCAIVSAEVTGSLLCELTPGNVETTSLNQMCAEGVSGKQKWTKVEETGTAHELVVLGESATMSKNNKIKIEIKLEFSF